MEGVGRQRAAPGRRRTGVVALLDTGPGGTSTTSSTCGYETCGLPQERFYAVAGVVAGLGAAFYGIATAKPSG